MKAHPLAWQILRIFFGAFFVWSGWLKVVDPILFTEAVRNFDIVPDPFAAAVALFVPWVEVIGGLAVIFGVFSAGGVGILFASMIVFTLAIAASWARGLDISCGCFGGDGPINYPVKIAQNIAIIAVGWILWRNESAKADAHFSESSPASAQPK